MLASSYLLGYLLLANLVPGGRFETIYSFKDNPFISALRPAERLTEFPRTSPSNGQAIIGDPVYFDLHLPSSFENIELTILYENPKNQKWTLDAFTDRNLWKFINAAIHVRAKDGKEEARAVFSTTGLDIASRTITFIIGAPEARDLNELRIYEIKIIATKSPLSAREALLKIFSVLRRKIINHQWKQQLN